MMNIAKFLKGTTTINELMNMPARYIHTMYKEYTTAMSQPNGAQNLANQEINDEIEEAMGG